MDEDQQGRSAASSNAADRAAGEVALQMVEFILFALIDRGIVDKDQLVAEIETLEAPQTSQHEQSLAAKMRLKQLAISLAAYRPPA